MATVIDALVVTLGLNSKNFVDGIKGSSDAVSSFATKALGLFGVVSSIEGVIGYFKDLHTQLADVGFAARNLGIASTEISRFGEVAELMGGQASDAVSSIQGLQGAIFNLQYRGQISDQLIMLQRFGVAYLNAAGHMRDFKDIAMDAAGAVERQARAAGMNQGERLQLSMSMGFTGGVAAAVAQGGRGLEKALSDANTDQKALTGRVIDSQVKLDQDLTRLHYATMANSAAILAKLTPEIERAVWGLHHLADEMLPKVITAIDGVEKFFKNPPAWIKDIEGAFKNPPPWLKGVETFLGPTGTLIAALAALSVAVGAGGALVAGMASLATAIALAPLRLGAGVAGAGMAGVAGLASKVLPVGAAVGAGIGLGYLLDKLPGIGPIFEAIGDKIAQSVQDAMDRYNAQPHPAAPWQPGGIGGPSAPIVLAPSSVPPAPPTPNAPRPMASGGSAGTPTAMNLGGGTQVQIDSMVIQTRSTDAYGLASDMNDALMRKLVVANADGAVA